MTEHKTDIIPKMDSYINISYIIAFIADICFQESNKNDYKTQIILHQLMDIASKDCIIDSLLILVEANGSEILDSFFWGQHFENIQRYKNNIYFF